LYKNIHVYLDDGLSMPKIHFNKRTPDVIHRGFTIDGLYVNGVRIEKLSEMDLCIGDSIEDIVFL
ncbi:MAG: hypothetical protein IJZ90_00305, partial [Clostridia bacterium]|nr:hypothetical protein [Clostridia bacterium]